MSCFGDRRRKVKCKFKVLLLATIGDFDKIFDKSRELLSLYMHDGAVWDIPRPPGSISTQLLL
jgi:hypothetical protein